MHRVLNSGQSVGASPAAEELLMNRFVALVVAVAAVVLAVADVMPGGH
ncbi:MAG TPA: hypothetical protein VIJ03_10545 [Candidatus Dormibacteraeota bacterium]